MFLAKIDNFINVCFKMNLLNALIHVHTRDDTTTTLYIGTEMDIKPILPV